LESFSADILPSLTEKPCWKNNINQFNRSGLNLIKAVSLVSILTILVSVSLGAFMITEEEQPVLQESVSFIHAHQFWNELPLGMGNETVLNQTGLLKIDLKSFFRDAGSVNVSVYDGERLVFSMENTNKTMYREVFVTEGMAVQTLAEGNHSVSETPIGDFYVVHFSLFN
jgi:hypothetical protein